MELSTMLTLSQENKIMENLFDGPNNVSDFDGISLLGSGDEEMMNLAPFITGTPPQPMTNYEEHKPLPPIKEEEQELEAFEPEPVGHYISMATCQLPSREEFPGLFNFQLDVNSMNTSKSCLYSKNLNKMFTMVNSKCPMKFKCTGTDNEILYLRALPLFTSPECVLCPVIRCMHHQNTCTSTYAAEYKDHVLRASHPQARYENDPDSERLSVVIPLDKVQPGSDTVTAMYSFHCKNSCPGGMNRNPTVVVFTLENAYGIVQGRTSVQFRVCSCPKRDHQKEESDRVKAERSGHLKKGSPTDLDEQPRSAKRKARVVDKNEDSFKMDGFVETISMKWMAPKMAKFALKLLLFKANKPGETLTPQELYLKAHYEKAIETVKRH